MPRATVPKFNSLRPSGALTFLQPDPDPSESPSESPSDPTSLPYPPDDSPSASDELSDGPTDPSGAGRTSSTASSGSALSKRALRDSCRKGVLVAGGVAHTLHGFLTHDEIAKAYDVYLADEDDAQAIGDPLASIAQRRGGLGAAGNPDVADALAALIGLAMYGMKQLARFGEARAYRHAVASGTAGAGTDDGADQGAEAVSGAQGA